MTSPERVLTFSPVSQQQKSAEEEIANQYAAVRKQTEVLAAPLAAEDQMVQSYAEGLREIGAVPGSFCFDNEAPRHKVFIPAFRLATRLVTCGEYLSFMEDRGYSRPELWLSDGWKVVQTHGWTAPLYWEKSPMGEWRQFTLAGTRRVEENEPVCHVSLYEADAFARWAGARLPTEFDG